MTVPGAIPRPRKHRLLVPPGVTFAAHGKEARVRSTSSRSRCFALALGFGLAAALPSLAADKELAAGCAPQVPPDSWSLRQIAREGAPYEEGERVLLLAWEIVEDDRPLRVESALVMRVAGD